MDRQQIPTLTRWVGCLVVVTDKPLKKRQKEQHLVGEESFGAKNLSWRNPLSNCGGRI